MKHGSLHHILSYMCWYHDDSYKQTMLGLYTHFSRKMIENHVNMVPNALLTRKLKGGSSGVSCQSHNYICHV